ncbi:hypothetical protein HJG45_05545 [Roseicella sp. DB1501]|nr:hypothetical protein [Roseicella sp. DB1501]
MNGIQAEINNVLSAAGITPSTGSSTQLRDAIQALTRIKLQANTTLYVATTGSDTTGTGTSGNPFATLTTAWNYAVGSLDLNGYNLTFQLANGTYAAQTVTGNLHGYTGQTITVIGNTSTPASVIIAGTSAVAVSAVRATPFIIRSMKITSTGTAGTFSTGGIGILSMQGSNVSFGNIEFGACGYAHLYASSNASIGTYATTASSVTYTVSGDAAYHMVGSDGGVCSNAGAAVTLSGTRAFTAFALASFGEVFSYSNTYTGSATGSRYLATLGGIISTNGGGASALPGNAAGTTSNGGQYV